MNYHSFRRISLLLGLILVVMYACTNKKADQIAPVISGVDCDTVNLSFVNDIMPILQQNCALSGCHNAATNSGGYTYESYAGFMEPINNGRLLGAINRQQGFVPMPKNAPKLSDCDIAKITHWIEIGAPDN
jgi:hypothetical protein